MDRVAINTAQNVHIDFEAAGIGDRVVAAMIDYAILMSYLLAGAIFLDDVPPAVYIVLLLPYLLYFLVAELVFNGQSIGKKARGIRVARLDGGQPRPGDYVLRWLFRLIEIDMTGGVVGLVTMFLRGRGQRLGDIAAGTLVVRVPRRVDLSDTMLAGVDPAYRPVFEQVDALDDEDIRLVRDVLAVLERDPGQAGTLGRRLQERLLAKMNARSELEPTPFLETVLRDYNYLGRTRSGV